MRQVRAERSRNRARTALVLAAWLMLVRTGAAAPPPDPAQAGQWLAFAWVDLESVKDEGMRRADVNAAMGALRAALGVLPGADGGERAILEAAGAAALKGPVALVALAGDEEKKVRLLTATRGAGGDEDAAAFPQFVAQGDVPALPGPLGPESFEEWPAHRTTGAAASGGGERVFELAVNVNALRRWFEEGFVAGRAGGVLAALRLANSRVVGVQGFLIQPESVVTRDSSLPRTHGGAAVGKYAGPPLLSLVATWSARSEAAGRVTAFPLTSSYWPAAQLGEAPSGGEGAGFLGAARVAWRPMLERALNVYGATLAAADQQAFHTAREGWKRDASAGRALSALEPWIVFSPGHKASAVGWSAILRRDVGVQAFAADFKAAIAPLGGDSGLVEKSPAGEGECARPDLRWAGLDLWWALGDTTRDQGTNPPVSSSARPKPDERKTAVHGGLGFAAAGSQK